MRTKRFSVLKFSKLNSFEQSLVLLHGLNLSKDMKILVELEQRDIINYLISDIHYIVVKRVFEKDKGRELTAYELDQIIKNKNISISNIPKCYLKDGDMDRITRDLDYLSKFNELYSLPSHDMVEGIVKDAYNGDSSKLMKLAGTESIREHYLLNRMGIEESIEKEIIDLDEKLDKKRNGKGKIKSSFSKTSA